MSDFLSGVLLAVRALRRNGLRSVLTITGLLIGVAAVVIVSGLTGGARSFVGYKFRSLGTNLLAIHRQSSVLKKGQVGITEDDARAISREISSVAYASPVLEQEVLLTYGERTIKTNLIGTTLPYFTIKAWSADRGDFWTASEEATKARVCVLGVAVVRQLFPAGEDPIGKLVRIGNFPFRVVGVLESKGLIFDGSFDQDDTVMMPLGCMRSRVARNRGRDVTTIVASSTSPGVAEKAKRQIDGLLRDRHRVVGKPDFRIISQARLLKMQARVTDALAAFLLCVAAMSLLVGGIGVMNIMLVSVTERTREIGIRIAVGANRRDVLAQFLFEAVVVSSIGGVLGVIFGTFALSGIEALLGWPMQVSSIMIVAGVLVSALTGIIFGYAPAYRASRLEPIEALRHE